MPSIPPLPSPDDDYAAPQGMRLGPAEWDAVFGSIGARLRTLEGKGATWDDLIALGTAQALASIAANLAPHMAESSAQLAVLQAGVEEALDIIADINAGIIPANAVQETELRIFLSPALRDGWNASISSLDGRITALKGAPPISLDSLAKLATAIGNDPNFASTLAAALAARVRMGSGVGQTANLIEIGWSAADRLKLSVDGSDQGDFWVDSTSPGVRFDLAQVLSGGQKAQARSNIAAAPIDSPTFSGPVSATGQISGAGIGAYGWGGDFARGIVFLNSAGSRLLEFNPVAATYVLPGADLLLNGTSVLAALGGKASQANLSALETVVSGKASQLALDTLAGVVEGKQDSLGFTPPRQIGGSTIYFEWTGSFLRAQVDGLNRGKVWTDGDSPGVTSVRMAGYEELSGPDTEFVGSTNQLFVQKVKHTAGTITVGCRHMEMLINGTWTIVGAVA